ncbi:MULTISPECIES: hypothetical protein [Bacillota]|uniref:hypothetical protein n=1 Tax=Bacillota TaxID=1239 RepID=UPI0039EE9807
MQQNEEIAVKSTLWQAYAQEKGLPSFETIVGRFGSWKAALLSAGLSSDKGMPTPHTPDKMYSKEELITIAKKHKSSFVNKTQWDEYSKLHKLPCSSTYTKHFGSWGLSLRAVGINPVIERTKKYTKNDLIKLAAQNLDLLSSSKRWRGCAASRNLPTYRTYIIYFGSWKNVQKSVELYLRKAN